MWLVGGRKCKKCWKNKKGQRKWSFSEIQSGVCLMSLDISWWKGSHSARKGQRQRAMRDSLQSGNRCKMLWEQLNALQTTQGEKKEEATTQLMAPGALKHCGTTLWCSEATVLLTRCSASGWYYWLRQIRGLEGFWQVDKCCLTRQSTGQTVRCSPTALTLHPSATQKGFELLSHTHTHGFSPSYEAIKCLNWLCPGGWIK